jgi:hypothetical protein
MKNTFNYLKTVASLGSQLIKPNLSGQDSGTTDNSVIDPIKVWRIPTFDSKPENLKANRRANRFLMHQFKRSQKLLDTGQYEKLFILY